mgnify:CR=1 FL=1
MSLNVFKNGQLVKIAGLNYVDPDDEILDYITADDDLVFQFSKDAATGRYGYLDANGDFVPFRSAHTLTYTPTTRASDIDMGETHEYRYVDTESVPNANSGTYTPTTRASNIDMGETNSYRYVTTTSIPNSNSGTYTVTTKSASDDMGETNAYRYVDTSAIPNANSETYTPTTNGAALDMGETNAYRYVDTTTVFSSAREFSWDTILGGGGAYCTSSALTLSLGGRSYTIPAGRKFVAWRIAANHSYWGPLVISDIASVCQYTAVGVGTYTSRGSFSMFGKTFYYTSDTTAYMPNSPSGRPIYEIHYSYDAQAALCYAVSSYLQNQLSIT